MAATTLPEAVAQLLEELERENASPQTLRAYRSDLHQFVAYLSPKDAVCPPPREIDLLVLREWVAHLFHQGLKSVTLRRKIAAVRRMWKFMAREAIVEVDVARLLVIPKAPKTLPRVPSAEQTNTLLDRIAGGELAQPDLARDVAIFELLYGCGLRVSELVGLDRDDIDFTDRVMRVRGKGRKERMVPFTERLGNVLEQWLEKREVPIGERAVFVSKRGKRMTDRAIRHLVKLYSIALTGDPTVHPHTFRHAYATHLLRDGANLREIQELLGHAQLSTTQKYTQVSLADLMAVYDKAHPRA
ncbi:MAG: tyrosine recombinase XerC [Bryobacterales bacterium]|nr:tyrosine recombinase XerC [Bryobacterales bacterium]